MEHRVLNETVESGPRCLLTELDQRLENSFPKSYPGTPSYIQSSVYVMNQLVPTSSKQLNLLVESERRPNAKAVIKALMRRMDFPLRLISLLF